jgi:transposase InsO family protein
VISDWRKEDYNHRRRHSSLGYQAPAGERPAEWWGLRVAGAAS